jgi:two-component system phosphate regulon response regulator PhoB/two-component system alkaline phosphatase synthesis response regulator PhoP
MNKLIAIVEDEKDIAELIELHLKRFNFNVISFDDAKSFMSFLHNKTPNLIILDLMLPDIDGMELCKNLKNDVKYSSIPIIILTARGGESDRILGLELGADDYVVKPFSPRELIARVKAVLRRGTNEGVSKKIKVGSFIEIDLDRHICLVDGKPLELTGAEFQIFYLLASKPGWVFSRDAILNHLWGNEKFVIDRTIDVHIRHLREKLGIHGGCIKSVRGVGYKLEI